MPPSSQAPCATPSPRGSGGPGPHPALATLCKAHVSPRRGGSQGEGTGRGPFRAPPPVGCGHDSRLALPRTPWRSLWHRGVSGDSRLSPGDPGASQTSVWWAAPCLPCSKPSSPRPPQAAHPAPAPQPLPAAPRPAGSRPYGGWGRLRCAATVLPLWQPVRPLLLVTSRPSLRARPPVFLLWLFEQAARKGSAGRLPLAGPTSRSSLAGRSLCLGGGCFQDGKWMARPQTPMALPGPCGYHSGRGRPESGAQTDPGVGDGGVCPVAGEWWPCGRSASRGSRWLEPRRPAWVTVCASLVCCSVPRMSP